MRAEIRATLATGSPGAIVNTSSSAAPSSPSTAEGAVQRTVFLARHAGRELGGTGTVSDDTGCCESTSDR
jgi:hypothetical protein